VEAGGGAPSPTRRIGIRPGSLRTIGALASTGALAATPPGTLTRLAWTGCRITSADPETAVIPPGAFQLT
jgi:hypothetical protein